MKGWIKRWIMLRFFMGCKSDSNVAIAASTSRLNRKDETSIRPFRLRKPSFINRMIHGLNHRGEEEEVEMEIGFPTDVKHLTHIGWDGSISNNDNSSSEIMCLPSISMNELELAMVAQANGTRNSPG